MTSPLLTIEPYDGHLCIKEETGTTVRYSPLSDDETLLVEAVADARERLRELCIEVPCAAPGCPHTILMTDRQHEELTRTFRDKYGKRGYICCSRDCQDAVQEMLAAEGYRKRAGKSS